MTKKQLDDNELESVCGGQGIAELKKDADPGGPIVDPIIDPPGGGNNSPWPQGNDGPGFQHYDEGYDVG